MNNDGEIRIGRLYVLQEVDVEEEEVTKNSST
jgi:hypothetical protein